MKNLGVAIRCRRFRAFGEAAKVIENEAEVVPSLPPSKAPKTAS